MVGEDQVHFVDFVVELHTEPIRHEVLHKVLATGRKEDEDNYEDEEGRYSQDQEDYQDKVEIMMTSRTCGRRALVAVSK